LDTQLDRYCIDITDVLLDDLDFDKEFSDAIVEKQVATQTALAARERVQTAKAEADQVIERARGEAQSINIKGRALRANPQVLDLTAIETFNDNVQIIYTPPGGNILLAPTGITRTGGQP
jgi:regulator of protease activity HflC (stomatin/prohibitin superfamily)